MALSGPAKNDETISAYAATHAGAALQRYEYNPPALGPEDVEVEISHCGMCHSDLHLINNDWGNSTYLLVPGHEIVGTLSSLGTAVTNVTAGQRAGVGWLARSCGRCEYCLGGAENLCSAAQPTCSGREGGYAARIRVHSDFAFPIPNTLPSAHAAPLLCGGVTVFAPLRRHGVDGSARRFSFSFQRARWILKISWP